MLKLYRVIGSIVFPAILAGPIFAGGSDVTEPHSSARSKSPHDNPPLAVHVGTEPPGSFVLAASALYQGGPGIGAGLGYRWARGITLVGQVAYADPNGMDGYTAQANELDRGGLIHHPMPPRYVTVPGWEPSRWGGVVTVLIPIGGGSR